MGSPGSYSAACRALNSTSEPCRANHIPGTIRSTFSPSNSCTATQCLAPELIFGKAHGIYQAITGGDYFKLICCMSVLAPGIWISIFSHTSFRSQLWQWGPELNDRLFQLSPTARDMGILAHRSLFSESQSTDDWKRLWHTAFLMLLVGHVLKTWLRAPGSPSLCVCHWNQQL